MACGTVVGDTWGRARVKVLGTCSQVEKISNRDLGSWPWLAGGAWAAASVVGDISEPDV